MFRKHGDTHNQVRDAHTAAQRSQPAPLKRTVVPRPGEAGKGQIQKVVNRPWKGSK